MSPVKPAHTSKPDPGEPWRYVCPACELQQIEYRGPTGGMGNSGSTDRYVYCRSCRRRQRAVLDKRTGQEVLVKNV